MPSTFVAKLRFPANQLPDAGDVVMAHVLDLGLGRPRTLLARVSADAEWQSIDSGLALQTTETRNLLIGWMPLDSHQEQHYRARFGFGA